MKYYCAIIGDIVKSRQLKNRNDLQYKFKETIKKVNELYDNYIASNFTVTLGDEFQGLLYDPSKFLEIIDYIKKDMHPIQLVFGVGIGPMYTEFSKFTSIGSDGPAYHYAREMVIMAKKKNPSICFKSNSIEDGIIMSNLKFIELHKKRYTKRQNEIIDLYEKCHSQKEVALRLNLTQSAVSQSLDKSGYHYVNFAEEQIKKFLHQKYCVNCI